MGAISNLLGFMFLKTMFYNDCAFTTTIMAAAYKFNNDFFLEYFFLNAGHFVWAEQVIELHAHSFLFLFFAME